uniref:glycosyltransferase n=1 Tax=Cupriavidus taiwanensis TaxID=164546 RepID=UPI0018DB9026|nr:glycosyltransferase [Cupriavidus taiwanensis]
MFADPFNSVTSGVTAYIREAMHVLSRKNWKSTVIGRKPSESIEAFRDRLSTEVQLLGRRVWMIEAPESLAASASIPSGFPIHIRLHLSRQLGKILQGHRAHERELRLERREIERARYVSAPSRSAVELSKMVFDLPDILVSGNPIASFSWNDKQKRFAGLFIGRWQALKGVDMLLKLCSHIPGKRIGVITDRSIEQNLPDGIELLDPKTVDAKRDLIRESHCVIVPSFFETASMVGLEALSVGTPVLTWSHVGLVEYASSPMVHAVEPFDISKLASALDKLHDSPLDYDRWRNRVAEINDGYFEVVERMRKGESFAGTFGLLTPPKTEWKKIIQEYRGSCMNKAQKSSFSRKLRKLRRDPVAFFRDSWIADIFVPPGSKLEVDRAGIMAKSPGTAVIQHAATSSKKGSNTLTPSSVEQIVVGAELLPSSKKDGTQIVLPEQLTQKTLPQSFDGKQAQLPCNQLREHLSDSSLALSNETPVADKCDHLIAPLFADINADQRIIFGNVESRRVGWRVGFFYAKEDSGLAADLISKMNQFDDFRPLQSENIYVGRFDLPAQLTALSIINRIDVANKAKISAIDHIVLLNAPVNFQEALRACGTKQKIVVIDTLDRGLEAVSLDADTLITVSENKTATAHVGLRKSIVVRDHRMIPFAIRRAIQEGGPKTLDMLIALVGRGEFNPDFLNFDANRFQGVIKLNSPVEFNSRSLEGFCQHLTRSIISIYVLDSVYCQYRSMCEQIESGRGLAEFLCATLKDGILFDVQY